MIACEIARCASSSSAVLTARWRWRSSSATPISRCAHSADSGLALVSQGRTREGFARLDEAMAAISAGDVDPIVAGKSFCAMLSACDRAGELERAVGVDAHRRPSRCSNPTAASRASCTRTAARRTARCCAPSGAGTTAKRPFSRRSDRPRRRATGIGSRRLTRLAELRLLQGRADEAASLLRPYEDRLQACGPLARLHALQGDHDLAAATITRGLSELNGDRLRESVLVVAARRDPSGDATTSTAAAAACSRLSRAASDVRHAGAPSDGVTRRAGGSPRRGPTPTRRWLRSSRRATRSRLTSVPSSPARSATRWPGCSRRRGDTAAAVSEARAALAIFERLGAVVDARPHDGAAPQPRARAPSGTDAGSRRTLTR